MRLQPGERFYCGYHEWVVHPFEARVIVAQGFVTINGVRLVAHQVGEVNGHPQIRVTGLDGYGVASEPWCPAISALPTVSTEALAA